MKKAYLAETNYEQSIPTYEAEMLFRGSNIVNICLGSLSYCLRKTKSGGLILTKELNS